MEALMAQAQSFQNKISAAQDSLATMHVKGIAENGAVVIDMTGKYDVTSVSVREDIVATGAENVSKMFLIAYKDAKSKADALIDKVMSEITGGASAE